MRVRVSSKDPSEIEADVVVCFAYEDATAPGAVENPRLLRALTAEMKAERFRGQPTERVMWNTDGDFPCQRFIVIGLGPRSDVPGETIRAGAARAVRAASRCSARRLALRLPDPDARDPGQEVRAAVEGALLGNYHFDRHLTDPSRKVFRPRSLEVSVARDTRGLAREAHRGEITAAATCLARDLVNEGPSRMNPEGLARAALHAARAAGIGCEVIQAAELKRLGMTALLAVARGSRQAARVVHLTYRPTGRRAAERKPIVLVGKGVTFDSGGLNLKPSDGMLTMKSDMAGAAAVLAVMSALPEIGCKSEVHALLGLVENMTGADAYKPGDILDSYSGKTVEVMNTDAEGRLVLCDLLAYAASRLDPRCVVDVATLTGACVVALGTRASGLLSRHDELAERILAAARTAGERVWRLPLYDEYLQLLQRGPADLKSTGSRWGGAITAGLFLGEFVPRELPWAHLDIAGPAFTETELPESRVGGTGVAVSTLIRWLEADRSAS
ncbi:MAG TPA: leucyl aminopeptidase [Candidatus Polarisedimenticolaceae bacterium]|nr:leucyl aminopeptidase [Candidatus Polarisedimenticolaceae bacterium]